MKHQRGVSLYTEVSEDILKQIKAGTYMEGDKLPTEPELGQHYNVSRTTIRMALQKLEIDGFITRMQGKGTFVKRQKHIENLSEDFKTFSDQMRDVGNGFYSKVICLQTISANPLSSTKLQVPERDPVIKLVRIRYVNNEPFVLVTSFIPLKIAPSLIDDDCSLSLLRLLTTKYLVKIKSATETLEASIIARAESVHLGVPEGSPAFVLEAVVYSDKEEPVEYSKNVIPGDLMKFAMQRKYLANDY